VVLAFLLSWVRGGFDLWPFIVFLMAGILATTAWQTVFSKETLYRVEAVAGKIPLHTPVRYALAFVALLAITLWSGAVVESAGFSGWLLSLVVWLIAPAVVCLLAPRFPVIFGVLAAACSVFSLAVQNSRLYSRQREIEWSHVLTDRVELLFSFTIAVLLSLVISIRVQASRQRL
jgi:hypothetical protein